MRYIVFLLMFPAIAFAQPKTTKDGRFQAFASTGSFVAIWRVDTETGLVSYCWPQYDKEGAAPARVVCVSTK